MCVVLVSFCMYELLQLFLRWSPWGLGPSFPEFDHSGNLGSGDVVFEHLIYCITSFPFGFRMSRPFLSFFCLFFFLLFFFFFFFRL